LSARYIPARQLPDKAVSVLDTACARVSISQHAVPAEVDDSRKRIDAFVTELAIIDRDETAGYEVAERRAAIEHAKTEEEARLATLTTGGRRKRPWSNRSWPCARLREGGQPVDVEAPAEDAGAGAPDRARPDGRVARRATPN
jgi:type VI secretion system protein VasG